MTDSNPNAHLIPVNELNFDQEVLASDLPVFIDVTATWCAPCKVARPLVASIARENVGRLKVVEIDGDECPGLVERLDVRGFPTFVGVAKGKVVERRAGFGGKRALEELARGLMEGT